MVMDVSVSNNEDDKATAKKGLPINFRSASSDDDLSNILQTIKSSKTPVISPTLYSFLRFHFTFLLFIYYIYVSIIQAVINYGASWCRVCSQILPVFSRLSKNFPKLSFIYADIDECPETTQHIRYTPTFQFFRDGERVDEMYGAGEERLLDRLWLHS